jgi:teichuronic acid biosynthesis glycosyltransferase TuaG
VLKDNFTVSVVIPNYNRSQLLIKAIESVLNQTFLPIEILVCDDGSSDDSYAFVKRLNHPIVQWLDCGKNGRPAIPRNKGIAAAKGNWVAFLDNDDTWHKEKLQIQIEAAQYSECKMICTNALIIQNGNSKVYHDSGNSGKITFTQLIQSNAIVCSSVMCEKQLLQTCSGFPETAQLKALEDYVLWLKISAKENIYYLHTPLVNYLDTPTTSIRNNSVDTLQQRALIVDYFKKHKQFLTSRQRQNLYDEFKGQYKSRLERLFDIERWQL